MRPANVIPLEPNNSAFRYCARCAAFGPVLRRHTRCYSCLATMEHRRRLTLRLVWALWLAFICTVVFYVATVPPLAPALAAIALAYCSVGVPATLYGRHREKTARQCTTDYLRH